MNRKARFVLFAQILVAVVFLVSCTAAPTPATTETQATSEPAAATAAPAEEASSGEPVEIRWFYRIPNAAEEKINNWLIATFNWEYAGKIHLTGYGVDDETYKTKLAVELSSDNPPDVFFNWEGGRAKDKIDSGYAAQLDDYYAKYGWEDQLVPAAVNLATYDGHKYFIATEIQASVVWYRTDIFAEYNLAVPKTWDELTTVADTLKQNGVTPFMMANQLRWPAQFDWSAIFVNTYGVQAYDDLVNNKIPWTDQKVVDTFAKIKSMVDDGWYVENPNSMDNAAAVIPFCNGEAAMWYQGTFLLSTLHGDKGTGFLCPVDFFVYPQIGEQAPTVSVYANETLMIHEKSTQKDAAAEFVNFVISTEAQQYKTNLRPFGAVEGLDYSKLSTVEQNLTALMANAGDFTFMHPDHAFSNTISDPFLDALQGVIGGAMTPEEAAAAVEAAATEFRGPVQ